MFKEAMIQKSTKKPWIAEARESSLCPDIIDSEQV